MKYQILILFVAIALGLSSCESATEQVNVYSGRHYQADEELFRQFTAQTGIEVNLLKGDSDQLINRMLVEGENTQADIFITADVIIPAAATPVKECPKGDNLNPVAKLSIVL